VEESLDRDRALVAGCDAVLFEPVAPDAMLAEIPRLLTLSWREPAGV
jgi:hypothetical protein